MPISGTRRSQAHHTLTRPSPTENTGSSPTVGSRVPSEAEDLLDRWVDWTVSALDGVMPMSDVGFADLVDPSLACLRDVLDTSLGTLLSRRRIAYCYPDRPMHYPIDASEFWNVAGSATFVVQTLEHYGEFFALVRDRFARRWVGRVHVACYVSPPGKDRFGPHRDEWHVAALALAGQKTFLFEGSESVGLSAGHVLVIPQGRIHHAGDPIAASRLREQSIHLSVALHGSAICS